MIILITRMITTELSLATGACRRLSLAKNPMSRAKENQKKSDLKKSAKMFEKFEGYKLVFLLKSRFRGCIGRSGKAPA